MKSPRDIGRPKNYVMQVNDAYRTGWDRVFGCRCIEENDASITTSATVNCPKHGTKPKQG